MDHFDHPTGVDMHHSAGTESNTAPDGSSWGPTQVASRHLARKTSTDLPTHLQRLSDEYVASYNDTNPHGTRMLHAQAFAIALLQHHYPEAEGYKVTSSSLGPTVKHGLNFYLKAKNGKDLFAPLPPKNNNNNKKGNKKPMAAQLDCQKKADDFKHYNLMLELTWHFIKPENIAGFEVLQKTPGEYEYRPLTYLAIIIDDLKTFPFIAPSNDVHRGDILTDALCRTQQIRHGYGVLLYGTRLEVYDFDIGQETDILEGEDGELTSTTPEPIATLAKNNNEEYMVLELRTAKLEQVDQMFGELVTREVKVLGVVGNSGENSGEVPEHQLVLLEKAGLESYVPEHVVFPLRNVRTQIDDFI